MDKREERRELRQVKIWCLQMEKTMAMITQEIKVKRRITSFERKT